MPVVQQIEFTKSRFGKLHLGDPHAIPPRPQTPRGGTGSISGVGDHQGHSQRGGRFWGSAAEQLDSSWTRDRHFCWFPGGYSVFRHIPRCCRVVSWVGGCQGGWERGGRFAGQLLSSWLAADQLASSWIRNMRASVFPGDLWALHGVTGLFSDVGNKNSPSPTDQ